MARIVSGFQTQGGEWDGGAILRGYKSGQEARLNEEQSRRANEGLELERMRLQFSIQQALQEQMKEESARQEQAKAGKLQQFTMRAQSGQVQPGQKIVDRIIGARGRLKDPKALAMFDDSVASLLKSQQQAKKRKAAEDAIGMAEIDKQVFAPEEVQMFRQRLDAGEEPDIVARDVMSQRQKKAELAVFQEENEALLSQAQQLVDAAQDGFGKQQAKIALTTALQSDAMRQRKGSGAMVLRQVQEALLGPRSEYGQGQQDPFSDPEERDKAIRALEDMEEPVTEQAIRARIGRKYGQRPRPTPQEEQIGKTRREAADKPYFLERRNAGIGRVVSQAVQGGARGAEIVKLLRDQGLDPGDPAVLAEIEKAVGGGQ